ncbi:MULTISPECIES: nitronate monooxygenase [unclassified Sphingomonas]|uniref:NAD(P)H-dependent flavin oxidoreductase n=1 Tax=unclassified Sphingomonas TaxID=196159 RepID=UPI0009267B65|nr:MULTISPECIES: nitronate monooxygenase [unclassified Sphingomonas]MBN8848651.1 nitronate monooxygenase [Sphingomonas sp.]OJV34896.1 MAG: 2-nitropropane dioxygenase [Sphingomonas sp. 67-36]
MHELTTPGTVSRSDLRGRWRLALPAIAAPMFLVSGYDLVLAACTAGVVGAFPTVNVGDGDTLRTFLSRLGQALEGGKAAPACPNLVMRDPRTPEHLRVLADMSPEILITSVGSPRPAIAALRDRGTFIFADVATLKHAEQAIADGVDGLVLLTAGAGGNSGWLNPFAFVREVRTMFDGPIAIAGGMIDGRAIRAAELLGCDLAYVGTRFIAAAESMASERYRDMLVASSMDDVVTTKAFTGLDANILRPSIVAAGLDPGALEESISAQDAKLAYGAGDGPRRWRDIWSAGHTVSGVHKVMPLREIVDQIAEEYRQSDPVERARV